VQSKKDCPCYTARVLKDVKVAASPKRIQEKLKACGLRPINNIVDATNYVMLETGQPLHAFDLDKIENKEIIVRRAMEKEKIIALNDEKYLLDKDILVIADAKSPLAIAGIKGGKKAEIDKNTKTIVLESANFDSSLIRRACQKINLRTDASLRFEHKINPGLTELAINRAAQLIAETAKAKVLKGTVSQRFFKKQVKKTRLDLNYVKSLLGMDISLKEASEILKRLGFGVKNIGPGNIEVQAPDFRLDIFLPEDLIEEIGRIKGYENIPSIFPLAYLAPPKKNFDVFWQQTAKNILKETGFAESYNYSFLSDKEIGIFGFSKTMELENPISSEFKHLRPCLIPGLLKNAVSNFRYLDKVKMFELGKVFFSGKEKTMLSGILAVKKGQDSFLQAKGTVESLLNKMGVSSVWYDNWEHNPGYIWSRKKSAEIKTSGKKIGFLGEISSQVLKKMKVFGSVVAFEIDFEKLSKTASEEREYEPVSSYPAAVRDIAVLVPLGVKVVEAMNVINSAAGSLAIDIDLFDIYEGEGLPQGKKNLAFHIVYQAKNKTLDSDDINKVQEKVIKALEKNPEWQVRR